MATAVDLESTVGVDTFDSTHLEQEPGMGTDLTKCSYPMVAVDEPGVVHL